MLDDPDLRLHVRGYSEPVTMLLCSFTAAIFCSSLACIQRDLHTIFLLLRISNQTSNREHFNLSNMETKNLPILILLQRKQQEL